MIYVKIFYPSFLVYRSEQRNDQINAEQRDKEPVNVLELCVEDTVGHAVESPVQTFVRLSEQHSPQHLTVLPQQSEYAPRQERYNGFFEALCKEFLCRIPLLVIDQRSAGNHKKHRNGKV